MLRTEIRTLLGPKQGTRPLESRLGQSRSFYRTGLSFFLNLDPHHCCVALVKLQSQAIGPTDITLVNFLFSARGLRPSPPDFAG